MDFSLAKLSRWMLVMAAAAPLAVGAQQSGQPISFSSPQNGDEAPVTPSLAPDSSRLDFLPGTVQAPMSIFNYNTPNDGLALPAPPENPVARQQMKKLLEERNNWALLTPEEILGGSTPEKMLNPPERDALGREKTPSPMERYLERESSLRNGVTNGWQNIQVNSPWSVARDREEANPSDPARENSTTALSLSQFLDNQRNHEDSANQNGNFGRNLFRRVPPPVVIKPDPEQLAAMKRFRQLLSPSADPTTEPSSDSKFQQLLSANANPPESSSENNFFPSAKPAADPFITQPDFVPNPAGASFTPLNRDIAKPAGLTPLPGTVTKSPLTFAAPSWKPQPPPWLQQGPQPFVLPQPKGF